jgi:hypothetical protein
MKEAMFLPLKDAKDIWISWMNCRLSRLLESVAILGLNVALTGAYNTDVLQVWYRSIDIHFILFYVKFEDGLSTSVLNTEATRLKKLHLEIEKFLKKSNA